MNEKDRRGDRQAGRRKEKQKRMYEQMGSNAVCRPLSFGPTERLRKEASWQEQNP